MRVPPIVHDQLQGWIGDIMDKGQVGQFLEINGIPAEDTEGITEQPFLCSDQLCSPRMMQTWNLPSRKSL